MSSRVQIIDVSAETERRVNFFQHFLSFAQKNRTVILVGVLAVLFFFSGLWIIGRDYLVRPDPNVQIIPANRELVVPGDGQSASQVLPAAAGAGIYVDLSGAVIRPGLYHLSGEARVNDLLVAAGGLSAEADREWLSQSINLAQKLQDGVKIYIPAVNEKIKNNNVESGEIAGAIVGKININLATKAELEALPKIGPATAQKIIDYRNTHGSFTTIEDLKKVSGIGEKTFEELKELITVY